MVTAYGPINNVIAENRLRIYDGRSEVKLNNWRSLRASLSRAIWALASAYLDNDWSSPDSTALFELAALNLSMDMPVRGTIPFRLVNWLVHRARPNTRRGSRRNIEAHYDLGNEFYQLWLDAKMIYSSAIFRAG